MKKEDLEGKNPEYIKNLQNYLSTNLQKSEVTCVNHPIKLDPDENRKKHYLRNPHRLKANICCLWMNGFAPAGSRPDLLGQGSCLAPLALPSLRASCTRNRECLDQGFSGLKDWQTYTRERQDGVKLLPNENQKKGAQWKHAPDRTGSRMFTEALFIITKRWEIITQTKIINRRMDKMSVGESHNKAETTAKHSMDESYTDNMLHKSQNQKQRRLHDFICLQLENRKTWPMWQVSQ